MSATADRLLDAQVAWLVGRITGPGFPELVEADVRSVLEAFRRTPLDAVVDAEEVKAVTRRLLAQVPPSVTSSTVVELLAGIVHTGPPPGTTLADVLDRDTLAQLLERLPASAPTLGQLLDRVSTNPQLSAVAAGFVARIVNDVVAANRAAAERIPGVGSLVSFGASAAGRVMGAADRQLDALIGETAARGAGFVTRRLNRIILETLRDPKLREAVLAVYDEHADRPLPPSDRFVSAEEALRLGEAVQEALITAGGTESVLHLVDTVIDRFLAVYGGHPLGTLIEELGLDSDQVAADLTPPLVRGIRAVHDAGQLEAVLRERLAPFYASEEVAAILSGPS